MPWLFALLLATSSSPAPPRMQGFFDAAQLAAVCGVDTPSARSICLGYVVGSLDQVMAQQSRRRPSRRTICPPAGMTAQDVVKVVARHSKFAETATGLGAAGFVRFALEDAYPCARLGRASS